MAANGEDHPELSEQGSISVNSPSKTMHSKAKFKAPADKTSKISLSTDKPKRPPTTTELPEQAPTDTMAIGNKDYEMMLMLERRLGTFYKRNKMEDACKWATLNATAFRASLNATLRGVIRRLLLKDHFESETNITARLDFVVPKLVAGICMMTYLRLRTVNFGLEDEGNVYMVKPKTSAPLEIPKPFAIALQQLGAIEIVGLPNRVIAYPALETTDAANFLQVTASRYKPNEYAQAVEYCKSIGMQFAPIDNSSKAGSAWWLFQGHTDDGAFQLTCPLPESNFTEQDALLHLMFCATMDSTFGSQLFTLGELNTGNHGFMLRNPHDEANINSYFAYSDDPLSQLWKIE